jgi:ribonuclease R
MLLANVSAANFLRQHKMPGLYRVHEGPNKDKLPDLHTFLAECGLKFRGAGKTPKPMDYMRLISRIKDRPDAHLIQTVLLRSMMQAVYQPQCCQHFGLAYKAYCHFTSPIRRYPDLIVHRAISHKLEGKTPDTFAYTEQTLVSHGNHCSTTERRADEATRGAVSWLKCEYMQDKLGETFDGIISGVVSFGVFVELKDIYIDGLVHITSLRNDYYHFDAIHHRLIGKRSGMVYRLGDPIRITVARVNLDERQIDFDLVDE